MYVPIFDQRAGELEHKGKTYKVKRATPLSLKSRTTIVTTCRLAPTTGKCCTSNSIRMPFSYGARLLP